MSLKDIMEIPELEPYRDNLRYMGFHLDFNRKEDEDFYIPLSEKGWAGPLALKGCQYLLDRVNQGKVEIHYVYHEEEWCMDGSKRDVNIIRFVPEEIDPDKPYIVLCSGGGYSCVCHHVEAYPTAMHFIEAGYQVFAMTYRVRMAGSLPAALEDVAAAIRYIKAHEKEFGLNGDAYAIGGYSAGGNLITNWGVGAIGYRAYGIAKPVAMFPIYAAVKIDFDEESAEKDPEYLAFLKSMLGNEISAEVIAKYTVLKNIDGEYPPCYLVCGKDDEVVSCSNSEEMYEKLVECGVPAVLEEVEHAPHGFGDGAGFEVDGWPERAIRFLEEQVG